MPELATSFCLVDLSRRSQGSELLPMAVERLNIPCPPSRGRGRYQLHWVQKVDLGAVKRAGAANETVTIFEIVAEL
jgi:hypothetical protein